MEIKIRPENYDSCEKPKFDQEYDFLLFRQDWSKSESIYFTRYEVDEIFQKIVDGDIMLHSNYTTLYYKPKYESDAFKLIERVNNELKDTRGLNHKPIDDGDVWTG